jgi:PhnO protein
MLLRKANLKDCVWVYNTLEELRFPVSYSLLQFENYYKSCLKSNFFSFYIFCNDSESIGLVSLNKFYMPRYLGFGYEMEEFVIDKNHRGKGYSYKMIEAVKLIIQEDKTIRKLIIKSNGENSKHIYAKALNETDLVTFQVYLNKL